MQLTPWAFIKSQWTTLPPAAKVDLTGKTVIITGANVGLGFEAAKHFARMNPEKLILACRNKAKGEAALNRRRAIDILVENAGVSPSENLEFTADGWESSVQTNDLSTSLLGLLLLPRLLETAEKYNTTPRLVVLASELHYWAKLDKSVLDSPNPLREYALKDRLTSAKGGNNRYAVTKLLNILFIRALNDRLHRKPVIVNAVNPGYCYSSFRRNFKGIRRLFDKLMELAVARTTEEGSRIPVWAAVGAEEKKDELRGAYISSMKVEEPSDFVISKEGKAYQDKIWNVLIDELAKVDSKVAQVVEEYLTTAKN
ncbi:short-chain dehydrogenase [Gymnopilus junonius]|uniref:Short-chain dehydrogenase n=1 Tax=Gymnopilus junonius TaxID=109634 RepID=A0A9P5TPN5_GYMJU|nr:short-chain dehydrogenase [Gymnopilus junonius]